MDDLSSCLGAFLLIGVGFLSVAGRDNRRRKPSLSGGLLSGVYGMRRLLHTTTRFDRTTSSCCRKNRRNTLSSLAWRSTLTFCCHPPRNKLAKRRKERQDRFGYESYYSSYLVGSYAIQHVVVLTRGPYDRPPWREGRRAWPLFRCMPGS